ncbi:MAG: hypothetical protein QNJ47_19975 [Nostocaceae cyanobacterium]|nr:hypothetical protein [Nostocaceae cyanobacterium]
MNYICAKSNQSITLVKQIASSKEGEVWTTNHRNGYLAKIYHKDKFQPQQVQKLGLMINNPPKEPNSHLNHISFAWSHSMLKDNNGNCVGFLMPEIKDGKNLIDVYSPHRRNKILKL